MATRNLPGLGLVGGFPNRSNGWGAAMRTNLETLSMAVQLTVKSITEPVGTALVANGDVTIAPFGSGDDWKIAVMDEDIYKYHLPKPGFRAFVQDQNAIATFIGPNWFLEPLPRAESGASMMPFVVSQDVEMLGPEVVTDIAIPVVGSVVAVSTQVIEAITGSPSGFNVGIVGAPTQYGGGIGLAAGTTNVGQTYSPVTYAYGGVVPIRLAAVGGDFEEGLVRITIFGFSLVLPAI